MECDGCTLCCMVFPIPWLDKKAGEWCPHCDIGVGCKVWDNGVSEECKKFVCAYNQVNASPDMRPDRCKVIFEKVDKTMFLGTMHPHYNDAYKKKAIQREIKAMLKKGFSVVLNSYTIDKPIIIAGRDRRAKDVWLSLRAQSKERYGYG